MVFYGYTIGDADNPATPALGFDVYRYIIPAVPVAGAGNIAVTLVTTLVGGSFSGAAGTDLEGLGTSPRIQRISAVSEGPGLGQRVNNLDLPAVPVVQPFAGVARIFDDSGSDFYVNNQELATQYILQGEQIAAGGFRSALYRNTVPDANFGNTTLVKVGNSDPQFADGLAIYNYPVNRKVLNGQYTGNYIAFASDFALNDGDDEQIYAVNLNGGDILGNPIQLVNPDGTDFNVLTNATASGLPDPDTPDDGFDSGLAFTPDGKRIIAQTENGILYEISDFLDDQLGSVIGNGQATIQKLGRLTLGGLPIPGALTGNIEYEGLAIVSEDAAGNPIFTLP